jgi:hypothetical protein
MMSKFVLTSWMELLKMLKGKGLSSILPLSAVEFNDVVSKDTAKLAELLQGIRPTELLSKDTVETRDVAITSEDGDLKLPAKAGNLKMPPLAQGLVIPPVLPLNDTAKAEDLKLPAMIGNLKAPPMSKDQNIPPAVPLSSMAEARDRKQSAKAGKLKKAPPAGLKHPPPQQNPSVGGKHLPVVGGKHLPVLLSSKTKKRKKNAPVLPTRASALLKPTWDDTELEDLTQLAVAETFSEFASVHNPSVDIILEHCKTSQEEDRNFPWHLEGTG